MLFEGIDLILTLFVCRGIVSISVKRLHDLNLSGYWIILPLFFLAGFLIFGLLFDEEQASFPLIMVGFLYISSGIILFFVKGTNGDNKYGLDLLQMENLNIPRLPNLIVAFLFLFMSVYIPAYIFIEVQKEREKLVKERMEKEKKVDKKTKKLIK